MPRTERLTPRVNWLQVGLLGGLAVLLAGGWLVFAMAAGKAGLQKAVTAQGARTAGIAQVVTRTGVTEQGTKVQAVFGTPDYYRITGQEQAKEEVQPVVYAVFIVTEENHSKIDPPPIPVLVVDGQEVNAPVKQRLLTSSDHHRTRLIRFPRFAPNGEAYVAPEARKLELRWPQMRAEHAPDHTLRNPLLWELPLDYPGEASAAGVSPIMFLALTAGLFAALSPCLIQLSLYYMSTLAGVSLAGDGQAGPRWPVVRTALWFVAGVVVAYTAGGYLAGLVGNMIQAADVLGKWGRPIAVGSGLIIVAMGVYTGAAARAPVLCKMPLPALSRFAKQGGGPATAAMGFLISLGCLQCFGGAIFASLLLYVGSLGSPALGALMLFIFSLGVALPFLGAAMAWSRVVPYLHKVEKVVPYVALASSALMILFGVLMVLDRFHWVSGLILDWIPFLRA